MALNAHQTKELRHLISERRTALIAEIRADVAKARDEPFGELAGATPDSGDESVADLLQDLDQFDVSRDLTELRDLEAARERLASTNTTAGMSGFTPLRPADFWGLRPRPRFNGPPGRFGSRGRSFWPGFSGHCRFNAGTVGKR